MDIVTRRIRYSRRVDYLFRQIKMRFSDINGDHWLTTEDKKRLKEYYLENFITPRARKLLEKYYPEEFPVGQRADPGKKPPPRT